MRPASLAALGIAAYAAFLVATLPARFAARHLEAAARGGLAIDGAQGTIWRGSARATVATPGGRVAFERVAWNWRPSRLAAGKLSFDIAAAAPGLEARFQGARTLSRWEATALEATASAAAVVAAVPWIGAWRPEGQVVATSPALSTDGRELRGQARIEWRGAAVALSEVRPLGSYRADIDANGPAAKISVATVEGALRLSGQGTLTLPARLEFDGEARAQGAQAAALAPLLDLLGPRRPDGARTLRWIAR